MYSLVEAVAAQDCNKPCKQGLAAQPAFRNAAYAYEGFEEAPRGLWPRRVCLNSLSWMSISPLSITVLVRALCT